jgi:hypothetical protein
MKSLMKTKKVGRFADGGEVTTMADGSEQVNGSSESREAPSEPSSFKEAFAAARKGGAKTFEYKGKKYTTELASAKPSTPKQPSRSLSQGLGEKYAAVERAHRNMPAETSSAAREALTKMRDSSRSAYEKAAEAERTGKSVMKLASGGLVRLGGLKSHGKAC